MHTFLLMRGGELMRYYARRPSRDEAIALLAPQLPDVDFSSATIKLDCSNHDVTDWATPEAKAYIDSYQGD